MFKHKFENSVIPDNFEIPFKINLPDKVGQSFAVSTYGTWLHRFFFLRAELEGLRKMQEGQRLPNNYDTRVIMISPMIYPRIENLMANPECKIEKLMEGKMTIVNAQLEKNFFFPGETIKLMLNVDNSEIREACKVWISHKIHIVSLEPKNQFQRLLIAKKEWRPLAKAQQTNELELEFQLPTESPDKTKLGGKGYDEGMNVSLCRHIPPTYAGEKFGIEHYLQLTIEHEFSLWSKGHTERIPITMVLPPWDMKIDPSQVDMQQEFERIMREEQEEADQDAAEFSDTVAENEDWTKYKKSFLTNRKENTIDMSSFLLPRADDDEDDGRALINMANQYSDKDPGAAATLNIEGE